MQYFAQNLERLSHTNFQPTEIASKITYSVQIINVLNGESLKQSPDIPDLEYQGWEYENGLVSCIWMNGLPTPNALLS